MNVEGLARLLVREPFLQHLSPFLQPCIKHSNELRLGAVDQINPVITELPEDFAYFLSISPNLQINLLQFAHILGTNRINPKKKTYIFEKKISYTMTDKIIISNNRCFQIYLY